MSSAVADCVFCKIVAGEIPCQRVFENEHVLAFLDINPLSEGHTVVIPKVHAERLEGLDASQTAELARCFGTLATKLMQATGAGAYNVLQNNGALAGQVVPHVHFHLIPRRPDDGLGYRWNAKQAPPEELENLRARIEAVS
ncbi:MAG: HIT family protein [Planctomycetes bacterium]|nr:HIT family protein [Planctomycetota bacterium]